MRYYQILHILRFEIKTSNMAISVVDDFNSYECLKRKVEEIELNSNRIFVIESYMIEIVNRAAASTRVLVSFYFRLQFLQSADELLELMETWGFAISFATCQPGNRSEYIHVERVLVHGPRYADSPPVRRMWQLVLTYFQY